MRQAGLGQAAAKAGIPAEIAAESLQLLQLASRFDAFGHHGHAERMASPMIARTMVQVSCPPHMRETKPRSILMRLIGNGGRHDGLRRRGLSLRDRHAPHRHDRVRGVGRAFRLRRGPPRRLCLEGRAVHGRRLPAAGHRRRRARRDFHSRGGAARIWGPSPASSSSRCCNRSSPSCRCRKPAARSSTAW